jgi:hypothetical protein
LTDGNNYRKLTKKERMMKDVKEIQLGSEVMDLVTGFKGIAMGRTLFLNGCARIGVQPPMDKDGKIPDAQWFDEPQLKVLKEGKVKVGSRDTGGPCPSTPQRRKDYK